MTPELEKEIRILGLLDQLAFELGSDAALAERMAARMETSAGGRKLRNLIINRRAEQSYYKEEFALALKPYLDAIETSNPVLFLKASFGNIAIRTIYLRVYQSWLWLMDHHADKEKYKELKSRFEIQQNKHDVRIRRKTSVADVTLVGTTQSEQHDDLVPLQNRIDEFLRKEMVLEHELFEENNLSLNQESIDVILDSLAGLEGIIAKVEKNCVKILRRKS